MANTWPWVCEVAQSWQLCLAMWHSPMWDHPTYRAILSGPQRDNSVLCITGCPVSWHSDPPFPEKHLLMSGQGGYGCAGKIMVRSYYMIYVYTDTNLDLFFSVYMWVVLLTLVDLSRCMSGQNQSLCSVSEKGVRSWAGVLNTTHDY